MSDQPPYTLATGEDGDFGHGGAERASLQGRPWVGIRFDCCSVYARIYRNPEGTAYRGRCPRCLRSIRLAVGAGGTSARFFVAE